MWDWKTESVLAKGPARIAVFAAHPDDPDFGSGASCAVWADMGHHITYVIITNGDKGSDDRDLSRSDLIALREREQRAAAAVLGVAEIIFVGRPDGMVVPDLELRKELVRIIRQIKPDVVLCEHPTAFHFGESYINHPDHRAVAVATLEAVFPAAQNHRYFPELLDEGLEPHRVREVWMDSFGDEANTYVDVTATAQRKIKALLEHASQIEPDELENWVLPWLAETGKKHDPPFEYAESFTVVRINGEDSPPPEIEG
jgi:LmbE family N-acetylglucosaminyl deacetylase